MSMLYPLFGYQEEGYNRFLERGNLLLAFDTGLGKTATAIAAAEELLETRQVRRVLLAVPASLKFQWAKSLAKFTDLPTVEVTVDGETITVPAPSHCVIVEGKPFQRANVKYSAADDRERQFKAAMDPSVQYVIVGFDQLVDEWRQVKRLHCDFMVIDEATAIKTATAQRTIEVKSHFSSVPYRLALTATPIENRPEEVYSIMEWVDADVLGRYEFFDKTYIERDNWGNVQRYKNLDILHGKLSSAMVRKTRHDPDVAPYLPEVEHDVWKVELDVTTWAVYKLMARDLLDSYDDAPGFSKFNVHAHYGTIKEDKRGDKTALGRLMSIHEAMQMYLNHPALVTKSAELYGSTDNQGSKYAYELWRTGRLDDVWSVPKLDYLGTKVGEILRLDPQAKVLIFTRHKMMLRLMESLFTYEGWQSEIYDGDMNVRQKEAALTRFKTRPEIRLLLSSHAGAYGTDLPEANWLINYDITWGAGLARQINGRHVRASSEHQVVYIRDMVCTGTIEERKLDSQHFKNDLSSGIIDGESNANADLENDVGSLKSHVEQVLELDTLMD
jgi:SNF2 family DNA or RNA helicase